MMAWVQAHGGIESVVVLILLPAFNLFMSFLAKMFGLLKATEPQWLQNVGAWGLTATQWLGGNTPTADHVSASDLQTSALKPPVP